MTTLDRLTADPHPNDRDENAEYGLSQMRDSVAEIEGLSEDWPTHGNIPLAIVAGYSLHKSGREEAEAERDTAWNDAIEAAIDRIDGSWTWDDADFMAEVYDDLRHNLKKGEPT